MYQSLIELISDARDRENPIPKTEYQSLIELISDGNDRNPADIRIQVSISYRVNF